MLDWQRAGSRWQLVSIAGTPGVVKHPRLTLGFCQTWQLGRTPQEVEADEYILIQCLAKNNWQLLCLPNRTRRASEPPYPRRLWSHRLCTSKLHGPQWCRDHYENRKNRKEVAHHEALSRSCPHTAPSTSRSICTAPKLLDQLDCWRRFCSLPYMCKLHLRGSTKVQIQSYCFHAVLCVQRELDRSEWVELVRDNGLLLCEGSGFLGEFVWS